jgi:uncharacterized protein YacL
MKKEDFIKYFHTAFRNVGLFTSVSFAALAYARFYRGKDKLYDIIMIITSLIFLIIAILISYFLMNELQDLNKKINDVSLNKYVMFPKITIVLDLFILSLGFFTLFKQIF